MRATDMRPKLAIVWTSLTVVAALLISWGDRAFGESDRTTLFEHGKSQLQAGDFDEALRSFTRVLNLVQPDSRNAHIVLRYRALTYYEKGDLTDAWKDVDRVLRSPAAEGDIIARCRNIRGFIQRKKGREDKAVREFTAAIKVKHDDRDLRSASFANRGVSYINLDKPEKAISDFTQAIKLDRNSGFAYAGRGIAYLRADKIDKARRDSRKALTLNPNKQTREMAKKILEELSIEASGPLSVTVNMNSHGQIFVPVRFSKRGKQHRFLLDTGATYSLITRDLMKKISRETRVTKIRQDTVTIADGSKHKVTRYRIRNAFLSHLPLGDIEVHVFNSKSRRITNLLGTKSLKNIDVHIDNRSRKVRISRMGRR